jgi:hypothetical protein
MEVHDTWPPYSVITPEKESIDCHNLSTAKVVAERHPGSRILDNQRRVFIDQHPVFGLKVKVQS